MINAEKRHFAVPASVAGKAQMAGEAGLCWLQQLDGLVAELEGQWQIAVGEPMNGGSRALVLPATGISDDCPGGKAGLPCILKVELPDISEEEYRKGIRALQVAGGRGYAKLYACDVERRACLLEQLGEPLRESGHTAFRQMEILCEALQQTWQMPLGRDEEKDPAESIRWFRGHICGTWEALGHPCSQAVIERAMEYLDDREQNLRPEEFVWLHGDAHNNNMLRVLSEEEQYKLIDPEGLFFEKAYDLGVLMREWPEEYREDPRKSGRERSAFLHRLTGVEEQAIWEWGFLQMVSTALILLQISQERLGQEMLEIAEAWCHMA